MYHYRVLIVDDEPAIVDETVALLEKQTDMDLQIHYAYNGRDALSIIQQGRIDLLITDIEMPGMSGVELIKRISMRWPECKLIILTGYSHFNYAYEAVNAGAVAYILKSESDEKLLNAVHKAFAKFRSSMHTVLTVPHQAVTPARFSTENHCVFWLLCHAYQPMDASQKDVLQQILESYLGTYIQGPAQPVPHMRYNVYRFDVHHVTLADSHILNDYLEMAQTAFKETKGISVSFAAGLTSDDSQFDNTLLRLEHSIESNQLQIPMVHILPENEKKDGDRGNNLILYIKKYIKEHIRDDLSLTQLSEATGYSADYLSKTFKALTGVNLSQYISTKRIQEIIQLMQNESLSLENIASMTGFNSRAYFNHFFKNKVGVSPGYYRRTMMTQSGEE